MPSVLQALYFYLHMKSGNNQRQYALSLFYTKHICFTKVGYAISAACRRRLNFLSLRPELTYRGLQQTPKGSSPHHL